MTHPLPADAPVPYRDTWSGPVPGGFRLNRSRALPVLPTPAKPREYSACNGCGMCCSAEVCAVGRELGGFRAAPCPALEYDGGRFWCGMARNLQSYFPGTKDIEFAEFVVRVHLGMGMGCDSSDAAPAPAAGTEGTARP